MACNITDGKGRPDCPGETPGAKDTFYLYNTEEVASYTETALDVVSNITFDAGKGFYQVVAKKGSVEARWEQQDNDTGATDYTHEIDFRDVDLSAAAIYWGKSLDGVSLGCIVHTKGGKFLLYGKNDGLRKAVHNGTTNADELGQFFTLRETQVDEPPRPFLSSDEESTLTLIQSKIVGS